MTFFICLGIIMLVTSHTLVMQYREDVFRG